MDVLSECGYGYKQGDYSEMTINRELSKKKTCCANHKNENYVGVL